MVILCVNRGDSVERIQEYWKESKFALTAVQQHGKVVSKAFGVRAYPSNYLIGPDGKVVYRSVGYDPKAIRAALATIPVVSDREQQILSALGYVEDPPPAEQQEVAGEQSGPAAEVDPARAALDASVARHAQAKSLLARGTMTDFHPAMPSREMQIGSKRYFELAYDRKAGFHLTFQEDGQESIGIELTTQEDGFFVVDHDAGIAFPLGESLADAFGPLPSPPLAALFGFDLDAAEIGPPSLLPNEEAGEDRLGIGHEAAFEGVTAVFETWHRPGGGLASLRLSSEEFRLDVEFSGYKLDAPIPPERFAVEIPEEYMLDFESSFGSYEESLLPVGQAAPDVEFLGMDDKRYSLASLRGKTVLLNFWFYH